MAALYFYIATHAQFIKVGVSDNPNQRLSQLKRDFNMPWKLHRVMKTSNAIYVEAAVVALCHRRYGPAGLIMTNGGVSNEAFEACPVAVSFEADYILRNPFRRMCKTCLEEFRPKRWTQEFCATECRRPVQSPKLERNLAHAIKSMRHARMQSDWPNEATLDAGTWDFVVATLEKASAFVEAKKPRAARQYDEQYNDEPI